ncbi:Pex19 protein family-domain-containing protein [Melampsora americana]|nr:Pex19 protein family-domain-containing protein [Melampsora americana]
MTNANVPMAASLDIEDDMDDFDDVLDQFKPATKTEAPGSNKLTESLSTVPSPPSAHPSPGQNESSDSEDESWQNTLPDDFARDLAEGMEALLSSMKEEDGGEFKKHLEAMMASDGDPASVNIFQALGAMAEADPTSPKAPTTPQAGGSTAGTASGASGAPPNFQDAIRNTMDKLKESDVSAKENAEPSSSPDDQLAALFEQMMSAQGGLPDESQLQNMLQGFMEELMSKQIMYEPLKEMNRQYPGWLNERKATLPKEDLDRYQTQSEIVAAVVKKFEDPAWDVEEKAGGEKFAARQQEVVDLLTKMQDCGSPPQELLGEMPPGLVGEDGMPNPEQCTIA